MAQSEEDEVFSFITEWFDPLPQLARQYRLKFFPSAHEVEMIDVKTKRLFLKRSACPEYMSLADFYLGAKVVLYGRELSVVQYGDELTRQRMTPKTAQAAFVISPDNFAASGRILRALLSSQQLTLAQLKLFQLNDKQALQLSDLFATAQQPEEDLGQHFATHRLIAGVVLGDDVVQQLAAASEALNATALAAGEQRSVWCTQSATATAQVAGYLFGRNSQKIGSTATFDSCTCCVIKPHAVKAGHTGAILDCILAQGYDISALQLFHLDKASAAEFFEVYQGVAPEYKDLIEHMITSPCIALEVRAEDAVATFRQTAGPWDVEMAKELRPHTLRALYGIDRARSGVYCTELPEEGEQECRYFFELMQN